MARSTSVDKRSVLPVFIVFVICCIVFSGVLHAQQTEEAPATEAVPTAEVATEIPTSDQAAKPEADEGACVHPGVKRECHRRAQLRSVRAVRFPVR